MPLGQTNRTRIQNALVQAAKNGEFYAVRYEPATGEARIETEQRIAPATALANEIAASYALDRNMGRSLQRQRQSWSFQLLLRFDREVTLELFEQQMLQSPLTLPREGEWPQVRLNMIRCTVSHPVQQQAAGGTSAMLVFEIEQGRN